jgi:ankyrin repeat protein
LVCIIIPSSVRAIGNGAFARCDLLRNVTISPTSAITQDEFANFFPTLHIKEITLDLMKGRFDELSLNRLCNNYNPMQGDQGDAFIHMVNPYPVKNFQDQDCFGMTPLHVLLCSGRDCYDTPAIQYMIEKCPDAMLIKDIWDEVPLAYALLGNGSIAVINLLLMTHSKRREAMPLDFVDMIHRLAKMGKSAPFVRDVI